MSQINTALIPAIRHSMGIDLPENISFELLKEKLAEYINHLIQADFEKLVSLLYRIDVSENKLKYLLKEYAGEDAGKIIAALIIERQLQKIKSRRQNSKRDDNMSDDEKW